MPPVVIDVRSAEDLRDVVHRAVQALAEGKLVAFPTETVYGVAASALDSKAVDRLIALKNRQVGHPFALAMKSADEALDYVPDLTVLGHRLARRCWPGPVTLVCDNNHPASLFRQLPENVRQAVSPSGTIGLRVPYNKVFLDTLRMIAGPVVLTSANRSGESDATTGQEVVAALGDSVQLVLDEGRTRFGQSSSVVKVTPDGFQMLRVGVMSENTLRRFASLMIVLVCTGNTCRSPMAEFLCRKLIAEKVGCKLEELEDHGVIIQSAGLSAMMGSRPAAEAVTVLKDQGLDLSLHESQPLTPQLVKQADIIWTMTRAHRHAILAHWPEAAARTALLNMDHTDIADPIGGPTDLYRRCASQIQAALEDRVKDLKH